MPLKRLTPTVQKYDLGYLRLWQDELAEIVRLTRQLPDVVVEIESDNNLLTDVQADLPQLGQRVNYFTVTARRRVAHEGEPVDVINVKLAKGRCLIEATEPDLTVTGLIEAIKSLTGNNRRLPSWLIPLFRATPGSFNATSYGESAVGILLIIASLLAGLVFGGSAIQHLNHFHSKPPVFWPLSIILAILGLLALAALAFGYTRARTVLLTATREEAPTFWQRKRADIAINVAVGIVLYLLGLLTAHL